MIATRSKRMLAFILSAAMLALMLAGCGSKSGSGQSDDQSQSAGGSDVAITEIKLPIVDTPLKLTYAREFVTAYAGPVMKDYNEMGCYQELEKKTGIHIENVQFSTAQKNEQFNLMMASNDLPDIINWAWSSYPGGPNNALSEGQIIKLNDYIEKYAPNLKRVLDADKETKRLVLTPEGDHYCFPYLTNDPYASVYGGIIIRKDWLEKLNLKMPATISEWYTVLKAFKEKDPNGNGKQDEVPMQPSNGAVTSNGAANLFPYDGWTGAWGIYGTYYQDNGKVKFGPIEPQFKDFLTEMKKWYDEGLIHKDFAATDQKLFDALTTGDQLGAFIGLSGNVTKYTDAVKKINPNASFVGAPYPSLKAGEKAQIGQYRVGFSGQGTAISKSCKHIKEAVEWLDYQYSEEGNQLMTFGVEGKSYTMANGKPQLTDEILKNPDGLSSSVAITKYSMHSIGGPFRVNVELSKQANATQPLINESINNWMLPSYPKLLMPLTYTADESVQRAQYGSDIDVYKMEMIAKFIMGIEPLSNFDKYVDKMKTMGVQTMIDTSQAAYDRLMKNSK